MSSNETTGIDALLIGYENHENLGLRSIASYLEAHNFRIQLLPFLPDRRSELLDLIIAYRPRLVGFSLIFQYSIDEFATFMRFLRTNGVHAHFTAGGHFPSLRPKQTLEMLPELDSIVRFEGEMTLPELLVLIDAPHKWPEIRGLAFRAGSEVVLTPLRPLIHNLDDLPPVFRHKPRFVANDVPMAAMLASRGCLFNCSFCSIRQFYGAPTGSLRRTRTPLKVVDEMLSLYEGKGVRFFSFQDDDFAARTVEQRRWVRDFLLALDRARLTKNIRWKISCRVDDFEDDTILREMVEHGLAAVYLGVESGNETGLRALNKRVSVEQNLAAIELIERHDIALAIGFMLFHPDATIETIREDISFLNKVGENGYFPINFCKMLPFAGTPIEDELRRTGRLRGTLTHPDYSFENPALDTFESYVQRVFTRRNFYPDGLIPQLQQADFDWRIEKSFGHQVGVDEKLSRLRRLVGRCNAFAVQTLARLLDQATSEGTRSPIQDEEKLSEIAAAEWEEEASVLIELKSMLISTSSIPNGLALQAECRP